MEFTLTGYSDLSGGQSARLSKKITQEDVDRFIAITSDTNPLHVDEDYASRTFFKQRVVHGMLTASLFSTLVGMYLPGIGAIYRSQTIEFVKPVYIGDTVTAHMTITRIDPKHEIIELHGVIENQQGEIVVKGIATASLIRGLI
ncbi:MAG: MaoC family dehydratase [Deltaproteobacteria bacterium]|nr:MaoC family dehydratase [Deltaproteobacteria bacterium]